LWKENGTLNLFDTGAGNTTFQVAETDGSKGAQGAGRVRAITLEKLMADYGLERIDLLKVDVEGAEKEIFEHASPWIDRVGLIAVELHDWIRSGSSESVRLAARNFPFEQQRGDVTYLARSEHALKLASIHEPLDGFPRLDSRFPLKILRTS